MGLERGAVALEPYTPTWRDRYRDAVEHLRSIAGDHFLAFEHVGSTAIEGMPSKPIVDVLGIVDNRETCWELVSGLPDAGYEYRPESGGPDRRFFVWGPPSNRTHYLHVVEREGDSHQRMVAFRDYLRDNPDVAAEYADLKRDLAARYPQDRAAYTANKHEFIVGVLDDALG